MKNRDVVLKPHEVNLLGHSVPVRKCITDSGNQRNDDYQHEYNQRRQNKGKVDEFPTHCSFLSVT